MEETEAMTDSEPLEIDPVELYRRYRAALATVPFRGQILDYGWGKLPASLNFSWAPYREMFQEYANELANGVNQLTRYVHQLRGWHVALATSDDDEKMEAFIEFIEPIASTAISLPYALRSRFIFATSHLCHQANRTLLGDRWLDDFPKDERVDFNVAENYGAMWPAYPSCRDAFAKVSRGDFTLNVRHLSHHRFPQHVLIGLSGMMVRKRIKSGQTQYVWGYTAPLQLNELADALADQCCHCYQAFDGFKALVREHEDAIAKQNP